MKKYNVINLILFVLTTIIEFFIIYLFAGAILPIFNNNDAAAIASIILIPIEFIIMGINFLLYLVILFIFIKIIKKSKFLNEKIKPLTFVTFILPTLYNILNIVLILIIFLR